LRIAITELKSNCATVDGNSPGPDDHDVGNLRWLAFCDATPPKFASVPAIDPVAAEVDGGEVADNPSESIIVRRLRCT
jgi:hypothetical protein